MKRLVEKGLSIEKVLEWSEKELKEMIYEVNFNVKKVVYIKKCAKIIQEEYNGILPNEIKLILALPGVGPKVANLFMQIAHNKLEGISVDTHVHRISNRLEWVDTKTPE